MMNQFRMILAAGVVMAIAAAAQAQTKPDQNAEGVAMLPIVKAVTMMSAAVPSSDIERSVAFYTKGLGMKVGGRQDFGELSEVPVMLPGGGAILTLVKQKADGAPVPARNVSNRIVLSVPDVKALQAQLTAAGYHLNGDVRENAQYHVSVGMVQDPDGNLIEMIQRSK